MRRFKQHAITMTLQHINELRETRDPHNATVADAIESVLRYVDTKEVRLGRCGSCVWLDDRIEQRTSIGYPCNAPRKHGKGTAHYKIRSTPACKKFYKAREINADID